MRGALTAVARSHQLLLLPDEQLSASPQDDASLGQLHPSTTHTHTQTHTDTHTHTHKHRHTGIKHTYIQKSYATKTLCRQLPQTGSDDKLFLVAIITLNDRLITASALTLPSSRSL